MSNNLSTHSNLLHKRVSNAEFTSLENKVLKQDEAIIQIFNILSIVQKKKALLLFHSH